MAVAVAGPVAREPKIPELDGLRGLAIVMVLVHHMGVFQNLGSYTTPLAHIGGPGWIGVDLFFVLSGFLITGILLRTKRDSHYLRNFYARRALRIFPLYFCYVALLQLLLEMHWLAPQVEHAVSQDIHWVWVYAANFRILGKGDFLDVFLNHFWSLSIEEHFYFLWPTIVLLIDDAKLRKLCIWGTVGVLALRTLLVLKSVPSSTVYTFTPCRMDGFFIGGFAALLFKDTVPNRKRLLVPALALLCVCGTTVLGSCVLSRTFTWSTPFMQSVGYTLTSAGFFALLLLTLVERGQGPLSRLFGSSGLRFFGKYSYALYVLHQPIYIIFDSVLPTTRVIDLTGSASLGYVLHSVASVGLSVVAALLSWNLLEMPFLRLKSLFEYRSASPNARTPIAATTEVVPGDTPVAFSVGDQAPVQRERAAL
jgi:peptidoglycan/LPS O-acetylase OafA/YrhL